MFTEENTILQPNGIERNSKDSDDTSNQADTKTNIPSRYFAILPKKPLFLKILS